MHKRLSITVAAKHLSEAIENVTYWDRARADKVVGADIGYDRAIKILREAEEDVTRSNPPRLYEVCVYDAEHAGYGHSPCVGNVTLLPHAGRDAVETALNIVHVYAPRGADQLVWSKSGLVA